MQLNRRIPSWSKLFTCFSEGWISPVFFFFLDVIILIGKSKTDLSDVAYHGRQNSKDLLTALIKINRNDMEEVNLIDKLIRGRRTVLFQWKSFPVGFSDSKMIFPEKKSTISR